MLLLYKLILLSTCFLTALITGLFYAYSCSVNTGLGRLPDAEYLRAMQSINRSILNPWFFTCFIGTLIMLPLCAWLIYQNETASITFYLVLASVFIYLIGVFGVTAFGNVPVNEVLDKFDTGSATAQEIQLQRLAFEKPWNRFHLVRTIASKLCLMVFLIAVVIRL